MVGSIPFTGERWHESPSLSLERTAEGAALHSVEMMTKLFSPLESKRPRSHCIPWEQEDASKVRFPSPRGEHGGINSLALSLSLSLSRKGEESLFLALEEQGRGLSSLLVLDAFV